ncbi:MraY family glycosyltransferase [Halpernia frigidisoli]|uniref:UDP-N-acetylmuramyl pentapeptide phosphotransferase/UDP-N-acetylglucosamine-1-phosphate transferase n=1 Tax=Halpernia frigidisoli TaxID=1125876 RepID=A0A1I3FCI9_9FLAO|nr:glycosyltransferase family 4 protein [Halpernia frigidisoli]SFI08909.1 UDP-N-acetylmuramyl pentapeptide phosphotransferase/UDP-N-acetylglucosamine-1-phosphate transferase [Halpernia frigidisoli]
MILYLVVAVLLFISMLLYFKVANKFNIIDKPNERSSHTEITLRGGGVIFPLAFLFFLATKLFLKNDETSSEIYYLNDFLIFGAGLFLICGISFVDDLMDLSSKIRLIFHFVSVSLLLYFINAFQIAPFWLIPVFYILIIGILNAFNFMDGINGITGFYSLVVLGALLYVNEFQINFTDNNFIIFPILASAVFLFFNFRKGAKCFMGDVGSLGIAFWIVALLGLLIIKTGDFKYILFLAVYGLDVIITILERLKMKENIFKPHRRHLYQLFANEKKIDHRMISVIYALIQTLICFVVIKTSSANYWIFIVLMIIAFIFYLFLKTAIKKNLKL